MQNEKQPGNINDTRRVEMKNVSNLDIAVFGTRKACAVTCLHKQRILYGLVVHSVHAVGHSRIHKRPKKLNCEEQLKKKHPGATEGEFND